MKRWQSVRKKFLNYWSKWISLYVILPPRHYCQLWIIQFVPEILWSNIGNSSVPPTEKWKTKQNKTKTDGNVESRRVIMWYAFKVRFCIEKWFHGLLAWSDYSTEKCKIWIGDEMDVIWPQVTCWKNKLLLSSQTGTSLTIHLYAIDEAEEPEFAVLARNKMDLVGFEGTHIYVPAYHRCWLVTSTECLWHFLYSGFPNWHVATLILVLVSLIFLILLGFFAFLVLSTGLHDSPWGPDPAFYAREDARS